MNKLNCKQYEVIVEHISSADASENILDIGFGNGGLLKKLSSLSQAKFYGIEISEDMINYASGKHKKLIQQNKIFLSFGNVESLFFNRNFFNKIYTVNTIYFGDNSLKAFSEINRVLKPKGLFFNVMYTKDWLDNLRYTRYGFTKNDPEEWKRMANAAGLTLLNRSDIQKGKSHCMIFQKK